MTSVERSATGEHATRPGERFPVEDSLYRLHRKMTIGDLPNDILLDIFDFYVDLPQPHYPFPTPDNASLDTWHTLIHVCQRWRHIVFASPRNLNLRLHCTNKTRVRTMLDIWPTLPIIVFCNRIPDSPLRGVRNIIAALEYRDRVCEIRLWGVPKSLLKRSPALKVPFPELKSIQLSLADNEWPPDLPDSFLGGSAPRLRSLDLYGIPFPAPQKLLSSTTDLVTLCLDDIPYSGYIPPNEMGTCLAALTKLEHISLSFRSRGPRFFWHDMTHPPLPEPTVLPVLTSLRFRGDGNYLETLVRRICLPLLKSLDVSLFPPILNAPPIREFIGRIEAFEAPYRADLAIYNKFANVTLSQSEVKVNCGTLKFGVLCNTFHEQLLSLSQLCDSLPLHSLSTLENLHIHGQFSHNHWLYDYPDNTQWLQLLRPFTSVKTLHVSENLALRIMRTLQESSGEGVIEVLPALQTIVLPGSRPSGPILEANTQFVEARRLSGRPVLVHYD